MTTNVASSVQFMVYVSGKPWTVSPYTAITIRNGRKQFWFYLNGQAMIAYKDKDKNFWYAGK